MVHSETGDPIGDLLLKIVLVVIAVILFVSIVPTSLGMFGIFSCSGCDPIVVAFGIAFLPVAAVFIFLYKSWRSFQ